MKVALAQLNSSSTWERNLSLLLTHIKKAKQKGAQAILFPENSLYMGPRRALAKLAQAMKHTVPQTLAQEAEKNRIAILLGGYPEAIVGTPKVFNTALFYDERGKRLARYRKRHLFDVKTPEGQRFKESKEMRAGNRLCRFAWRGFHVGLHICYDLRFPEDFRAQAAQGVDLFLLPAAFTFETGQAHWHSLLRARAIENFAYCLAPAQTGIHPGNLRTFGHSLGVDPWGEILKDAGTRPGLKLIEIFPGLSARYRKQFPTCGARSGQV